MSVTDEGIFPMNTHRRILHDAIPPRTVPVEGLAETPRTDPLDRTARGILILALALGGLGAGAVASPGHGAGHAISHQPAGTTRLTASASLTPDRPWMY